MLIRRCRGFTLIELLVVIAIIGILAAMLFPVFARARESARKIQCLSNVKNIAMAVQMYLQDYDRYPPHEDNPQVRQQLAAALTAARGCSKDCFDSWMDCRATEANPYLREPVILDEYIKNRDVWACPSARYHETIVANWGYGTGRWLDYYVDHITDCPVPRPCTDAFPPGWGGTATDTIVQGFNGGCGDASTGALQISIGVPRTLRDQSPSAYEDAARTVVVGDAGPTSLALDRASWIAYPDTCRIDSVACTLNSWQCGADWVNCSWTRDCGAEKGVPQWSTDPQFRKVYAKSRHLGGSNLGFADGHAKWMASEAILWGGENWSGYAQEPTQLFAIGTCTNPNIGP